MAKILLVDDDRDLLESGKMVLESEGHSVDTASNVGEAQANVKATKYDLILLDIMMESPDDGIDLAHKLKKDGVKAPVVMMSAVSRVTGYEYGKCDEVLPCTDFIEKPVTPKALIKKVNQVLKK